MVVNDFFIIDCQIYELFKPNSPVNAKPKNYHYYVASMPDLSHSVCRMSIVLYGMYCD